MIGRNQLLFIGDAVADAILAMSDDEIAELASMADAKSAWRIVAAAEHMTRLGSLAGGSAAESDNSENGKQRGSTTSPYLPKLVDRDEPDPQAEDRSDPNPLRPRLMPLPKDRG